MAEHPKQLTKEIQEKLHPDVFLKSQPSPIGRDKLIVIGSSTGGPQALEVVLSALPADTHLPPIIIVQHTQEGFSKSLAMRLDSKSNISVVELDKKEILKHDCAYIAKAGMQLKIGAEAGRYYAYPIEGPRISRHLPSVDILFRNANNIAGKSALGIILTGMGDDGSIGIKEMHQNGAYTIAQDEATCTVFGMPKQAIEAGAIDEIVALQNIAGKIVAYAEDRLPHKSGKNIDAQDDEQDEYHI